MFPSGFDPMAPSLRPGRPVEHRPVGRDEGRAKGRAREIALRSRAAARAQRHRGSPG